MHIGHLRSTVIGDTVIRVLEHVGHDAIRANHVGDWGAQFGSLLAYLSETGHNEQARTTALADLEKFYQAASKNLNKTPHLPKKPAVLSSNCKPATQSLRHSGSLSLRLL